MHHQAAVGQDNLKMTWGSIGQPSRIKPSRMADLWHHVLSSVSPVRTRTSPGDRGWPETWPTDGIMPCRPCHPFAPVHLRATEAGQKPGRPMASCLVQRVTRSHPYIAGRPHWNKVYLRCTTPWFNIQSCLKKQVHTSPSKCSVTVREAVAA